MQQMDKEQQGLPNESLSTDLETAPQEGVVVENDVNDKKANTASPQKTHLAYSKVGTAAIIVTLLLMVALAVGLGVGLTKSSSSDDDDTASNLSSRQPYNNQTQPQQRPACTADSDCTVKNVGNCCGYYPGCVHVKYEPRPEDACPDPNMVSVCGWHDIESCECNTYTGQCQEKIPQTETESKNIEGEDADPEQDPEKDGEPGPSQQQQEEENDPSENDQEPDSSRNDNEQEAYEVDYTCSTDQDCMKKNIGNCCGYYPACVNVDFTPDLDKACPEGASSICGFPEIDGCRCGQDGLCVGYQNPPSSPVAAPENRQRLLL